MATIEINNRQLTADPGKMIIEVADDNDIYIPRFCYHKKLSIAANCRMCLVEVERVGKAVPACATPITDGMKVFTKSPKAMAAQKAVMEFLLINHPLDCPICDQGGECELQDLSMGYGSDVSRYAESKRSVDDEDLGSLISTDMTRCIHCTRCVRFGEEVAGIRELGATGRGEHMQIGTYIKNSLHSEVSGNIIDLCPVGALTSKPYRYTARAWELQQRPSIAPHDCLGSHIYLHTRRNKVMRVVPQEHEAINETWLSDRDRYSYVGLHSPQRLDKPMIKQNGHWTETDWETALTHAVVGLQRTIKQHGVTALGGLISPQSSTEELYLFQKLLRAIGTQNIDHRLNAVDFRDEEKRSLYPGINIPYQEIDDQSAILLLGSHITREQPLAALRVRKAALNQAHVMSVQFIEAELNFPVSLSVKTKVHDFVNFYAEVAKAALDLNKNDLGAEFAPLLKNITVSDEARQIAKTLLDAPNALIILGQFVDNHVDASVLRSLTRLIADACDVKVAEMSPGPNSAGAWLAGAVPHREVGGLAVRHKGKDAKAMFESPLQAYLLFGVEPELDSSVAALALDALQQAEMVVAVTAYKSSALLSYANVLLPMATFVETSGTFINLEGKQQAFLGAVLPMGQSRPGWKILRVLGNLFALPDFEYNALDNITAEFNASLEAAQFDVPGHFIPKQLSSLGAGLMQIGAWSIYTSDAIVRRSEPLQQSASSEKWVLRLHPTQAKRHHVKEGQIVRVTQEDHVIELPVTIDERMPEDGVVIPCGFLDAPIIRSAFGPVHLTAGIEHD